MLSKTLQTAFSAILPTGNEVFYDRLPLNNTHRERRTGDSENWLCDIACVHSFTVKMLGFHKAVIINCCRFSVILLVLNHNLT